MRYSRIRASVRLELGFKPLTLGPLALQVILLEREDYFPFGSLAN